MFDAANWSRRSYARLIAGSALVSLGASVAHGQASPSGTAPVTPADVTPSASDPPADDSANSTENSTEVVVTGSRIRGVAPVGANLLVVGRDDIDKAPVSNTNELLQRVPQLALIGQNEGGSTAQAGAANATRQSSINLRGLGSRATLTLFNSRRVVPMGVQGQLVDPSTFPTIAIERVEVFADGASAVYGSDAVAGVVNFITRRNFQGFAVQARGALGDEYSEFQFGAIAGTRWETGSFMVAGEFGGQSDLLGIDRDFVTSNQAPFGGPDLRSQLCTPGNIVVGTTFYPIPAGGATSASQLSPGAPNRCDHSPNETLLPRVRRYSGVLSFRQELGDRVELFADGYMTERDYNYFQRTSDYLQTLVVPRTNAFYINPIPNQQSVRVQYNLRADVGPVRSYGKSFAYTGTGGVRVRISDAWRGELSYTYGRSDDERLVERRVTSSALAAALADSNPATAFNPFGPGGTSNSNVVQGLFNNTIRPYARDGLQLVTAQFDGPVITLPGGEVRVALGAEYRHETLVTGSFQGSNTAPVDTGFTISRNVSSAYAEMVVPIFGPGNATPFLQRLTINVAGRYEHNKDFGSTTNPRFGVTWTPVLGLDFRGSYGTSFRAPALIENTLRTSGFGLVPRTFVDPQSATGSSSGLSFVAGNPDLKPETATTWTVGLDVAPRALPGLRASLTYFDIDYTNQINTIDGDATVLQNPLYASLVIRNPTAAQIASFLTIDGIPTPLLGPIPPVVSFIVLGQRQNLAETRMAGLDYSLHYRFQTDVGAFTLGVFGSHLTNFKAAIISGAPLVNVRGRINYPNPDRLRGEVTWETGNFVASMFVNHQGSYLNNLVNPVFTIDSWTTFDLSATYSFGSNRITLGVNNVFDTDPPHSATLLGYDNAMVTPVGRLISLNVNRRF
jgi:iron complex outermembrane receptor protein